MAQAAQARPPFRASRFVALAAVTVAVVVVGVAAFNVYVNPRSDFPGQRFLPLVPDRSAQMLDLLRAQDAPPRTLVVGSSRVGDIPADAAASLGGHPAFVFHVDGGGVADARTVYELLVREGNRPARLVVGVDVAMLREEAARTAIADSPSAWRFVEDGTPGGIDPMRALGTLRWDYVQDSATVVGYALVTGYPPQTWASPWPEGGNRTRTGLEERLLRGDPAAAALRERGIDGFIVKQRAAFEKGRGEFSIVHWEDVADLVRTASATGTRVDVFLTPHHPRLIEALRGTLFDDVRREAQSRLPALCAPGVSAADFSDGRAFGADDRDWQDGVHYLDANARRLVAALADGRADVCGSLAQTG